MSDELQVMLAEIHKLADAGSYWACGDHAAPTLTRARIRTLARQVEVAVERLKAERDSLDSAMRRHLCPHDMADWLGCSMDHGCSVCDEADHGNKTHHAEVRAAFMAALDMALHQTVSDKPMTDDEAFASYLASRKDKP